MKVRILTITIIFVLAVPAAYVFGYKKGGNDNVYLDHVLIGKITAAEIEYCKKSEDPLACLIKFNEFRIEHALIFYSQYNTHTSPLAPYIFETPVKMQESAIDSAAKYYSTHAFHYTCKEAAYPDCKEIEDNVAKLIQSRSNKALKAQPSAAGDAASGAP